MDVLALVARGAMNKEIAAELFVSTESGTGSRLGRRAGLVTT